MYKNNFGYDYGSKVKVTKDLYNNKKYNIKIEGDDGGGGGLERNKVFFKLLYVSYVSNSRLSWTKLGR